jgi:Ras-related protein Rab-6A
MLKSYTVAKVCVAGSANSGKSSLLRRFVEDCYDENYDRTIGADYCSKTLTIADRLTKLQLWDLAGSEDSQSYIISFIKCAHVLIITCDMSQENGLEETKSYWEKIKPDIPDYCSVFLVGTKADLPRKITEEGLKQLAEENRVPPYTITSAKTSANVNTLFETVTRAAPVIEKNSLPSTAAIKVAPVVNKNSLSSTAKISDVGMFSKRSNLLYAVGCFLQALGEFMLFCIAKDICMIKEEETSYRTKVSNSLSVK